MRRVARNACRLIAAVAVVVAIVSSPAGAEIRIVEDEVFFTLVAPGAGEVYLVGDFNNWNETVEKMQRSGDTFEISLYLVEGTYRYKFVVDGRWISDPDNPPDDPARGSLLVLVERPAGLVMRETDPAAPAAGPGIRPDLRYIGQLRWNRPPDDTFEDDHYVDFGLEVERERLRADARIRTLDRSWDAGERSLGVTLDRARVGTDVAGLSADAFDNRAVVWDSSDPFSLVGGLGPYGYNAGFSRKGAAARYLFLETFQLHAVYADHTGQRRGLWPLLPPPDAAPAPPRGVRPDYTYVVSPDDSDVLGFEVLVDAHDFRAGIVTRSNRGLNPGTRAGVSLADSAATVFDTRENTGAQVYWLRVKKLFGLGLVLGYGRGSADTHELSRRPWRLLPGGRWVPAGAGEAVDETVRFEQSRRYSAGLDFRADRATSVAASWDRTTFEFVGPVYAPAEATVDRVSLSAAADARWWWMGLHARHTRQDYGDTPDDLLVDSPARNPWLDWRDTFGVPDIAAIDTGAYTDFLFFARWFPRADLAETGGEEAPPPAAVAARQRTRVPFPADPEPGVRLELGTTTRHLLGPAMYTRARAQVAWLFRDRIHALFDGRYAAYDRAVWGGRQSFVSGYVEAGYRRGWLNVNLGWGLDPVVFDETLGRFHDIGRTEVLRRAIAGGVARGTAAEVGERLLSLERRIRDTRTIKLELILTF